MKKYIILAALTIASIANATSLANDCNPTPSTQPLYYCNLTPDSNFSCDTTSANCTPNPCTVTTCNDSSYPDCSGGNNPWCGGGTPKCQVPDAANSLPLLGAAMTLIGLARKKLGSAK